MKRSLLKEEIDFLKQGNVFSGSAIEILGRASA